MEGFSFEDVKESIKTISRKITVTIAGITVAMAVNASPVHTNLQKMKMHDALEQSIAEAQTSGVTPHIKIDELNAIGSRVKQLNDSLATHGGNDLHDNAVSLWNCLVDKIAEIPFIKVFAQYNKASESLFLSFDFKNDYRMDATTYADDEDDLVYFSVAYKCDVFFQNALQRDVFLENAKSTYALLDGNQY